ncbi:bifunctional folylpolyglutamate synthase/dihydrofolate synthase [Facilibium subflavum]|uniref:bifunctional folylpolyglutamate synthase/dihydrofolate synthase n=1 Tax=Facilibium subflavum TaxID=2219058 RepID=UPI0013C36600|nr:cyanophycin synthetase [Facilibium subflavum]
MIQPESLINHFFDNSYPCCQFNDISLFINALNIQHKPHVITITGTNGKGSSVAVLEHFFEYNNIDYISHTSPHLCDFNERIRHNGQHIDDIALTAILDKLLQVSHILKLKLNYYQIAFLACCIYMNEKKPQWLILEVGIGGRLDPANVFNADIAVITYAGLDHTETLGNTIDEIAWEKAHIARTFKPVVLGEKLPKKAMDYLTEIQAITYYAQLPKIFKQTTLPITSLACALTVIDIIKQNTQYRLPQNIHQISIKGRFQVLQNSPTMIADVAHNIDAVKNLFKRLSPYQKSHKRIIAVFAAQKTKDTQAIVQYTKDKVDFWLLPSLQAIDPRFDSVQELKHKDDPHPHLIFNNFTDSYDYLKQIITDQDLVVVFGAFTLIGALLKAYEKQNLLCQ